MPELSHFDPGSAAALLVMDYQVDALYQVHDCSAVCGSDRVRG